MNNDGTSINQIFVQARTFLSEVGKLLLTADGQMSKHGWTPEDYKIISTAGKLEKADEWIPEYATRFYSNDKLPLVTAYISAVFDFYDSDGRAGVKRLTEPMLSYGGLYFASKKEINWWPWHGTMHFYRENYLTDGKFTPFEPKKIMAPSCCPATRIISAARPLVSITGPEVLAEKCVDPLLEQLKK